MLSGRSIPLSLPRRLVCDLTHSARSVPTVPVQKLINVHPLGILRSQLDEKMSWCTLFTKAYAVVAAEFSQLRRAYLSFPWARLYEHPENIASVAMERSYRGEYEVFFAHFYNPDKQSLQALEAQRRRSKEDPIESIADFRSSLRVCSLPKLLRRLAWWYITHVRGFRKAQWLGTFGVSVYSSLGAESLHPLSPLTTVLNYGVIQDNGDVMVRVIYDHRVMDGGTVARALARLEQVLHEDILAELRNLVRDSLPVNASVSQTA